MYDIICYGIYCWNVAIYEKVNACILPILASVEEAKGKDDDKSSEPSELCVPMREGKW